MQYKYIFNINLTITFFSDHKKLVLVFNIYQDIKSFTEISVHV